MGTRGEPEGPRDQVAIDLRVVGRDLRQQLVDELLMTLVSLDYCHTPIVRGALPATPRRVSSGGDLVPMMNERRPWLGSGADESGRQPAARRGSCSCSTVSRARARRRIARLGPRSARCANPPARTLSLR